MTDRRRKPPRLANHTTLTESGRRAAEAIARAGLLPYPGVISPRGGRGGEARVTVTAEPGRVRVGVSGGGHQEILVYGPVPREPLVEALEAEFGLGRVAVRDPGGLWAEEIPSAPVPGRG